MEILGVELLIALHRIQECRVADDFAAQMARAQETARLAQVRTVLGNHRRLVASARTKVSDELLALGTAHGVLPQVLKQSLAVQQAEGGLLQARDLAPHVTVGEWRRGSRARAPRLEDAGILQDAAGNELLVEVLALQCGLDTISRFAHESRMADRVLPHRPLLMSRSAREREGVKGVARSQQRQTLKVHLQRSCASRPSHLDAAVRSSDAGSATCTRLRPDLLAVYTAASACAISASPHTERVARRDTDIAPILRRYCRLNRSARRNPPRSRWRPGSIFSWATESGSGPRCPAEH